MVSYNLKFKLLCNKKDRDDYEEGYRFRCDYGYLNEQNLGKLKEDQPAFVLGYREANSTIELNEKIYGKENSKNG